MTQWEQCIISRYGSVKNYVLGQLSSGEPNAIKARFDLFYRIMEELVREGKDRNDAWFALSDYYDIQTDTIDDYILDAVLYSF